MSALVPVVRDVHLILAFCIAAATLVTGIKALRCTNPLPAEFWRWQLWTQWGMGLQPLTGVMLLMLGLREKDPVHYVYGGVVLLILLLERALASGKPMRQVLLADYGRFNERLVYGILNLAACLIIFRAITTGLFGF